MKIQTALFLMLLLVLASFGIAHAKALFFDDFEGGLSKQWFSGDLEGKGKWEVVDDKGNKVLKVDATASWSGASVDGVASLKEHGELWATDRVKVDAATGEIELGLLTNPKELSGNWYLDLRIGNDLMVDECAIKAHNPVAPVPIKGGKWYRMKIAVIKETFYGKMWAEDESEPKDWMISAKILSHLDEDGVGVMAYHTVAYFDDIIVAAGEDELVMAVSSSEKLATTWAKTKVAY
ncbi:hypothetical protein FJZ31_01940 [Candidatus Poribacteria bacterium]|nr:hypothetical protein [Candidatus Poribacteria bacterium]